jgi:peptidoglycan DL-endopeptidase CwlO
MTRHDFLDDTDLKQKLQEEMKKPKKLYHRFAVFVLLAILSIGLAIPSFVAADNFDAQINQLRTENEKKENRQETLLGEAASFQDKINGLQAQIRLLEEQIGKDQTRSDELRVRIAAVEKELVEQKKLLGQSIRKMYTEDDISTLEMLATSKDLSEFVDKEQYRSSVNEKVKKGLEKINALNKELQSKQDLLQKTIADKQKRSGSLDSQRAEVSRLLGMNASQRNALESQITNNNSKISRLRSEQAAANAALFGGGVLNVPDSSGYPWANYNPFPNSVADPWGMYLRQCVSYTAWKVWKSGRHMPYWGGRGNANKWDDNARAAGIPVNGTPKRGAVGVSNSGYYGHVVYVEHVYGDGRILISQYNASWTGRYSEAVVNKSKFVYIHF